MSLSFATLDAVGLMKLDPRLRRTGAGDADTAAVDQSESLHRICRVIKVGEHLLFDG